MEAEPAAPPPAAPKATARAASASTKLAISNDGTRRIVIGPPPKSKGGQRAMALAFDTKDDSLVDKAKRLGTAHLVEGERAESIKSNKVVAALAPKLGLRLA